MKDILIDLFAKVCRKWIYIITRHHQGTIIEVIWVRTRGVLYLPDDAYLENMSIARLLYNDEARRLISQNLRALGFDPNQPAATEEELRTFFSKRFPPL